MKITRAQGQYYIKEVANVTGLSKQLIRKWEDRYKLIEPKRLENGYQVYSDADVNTLLRVKSLQKQGHSIKQAAELISNELASNDSTSLRHSQKLPDNLDSYVIQLLEKGIQCDEKELNLLLHQAYHFYGLGKFLEAIVIPFLYEVGKRWETKEWDEYQESVASLVVRDYLVQIRRNFQYSASAPLVLGACLPNENHEIPVHILLLQLMTKGFRTILVGSSPAPGSIEALIKKVKPQKVLLSASSSLPFDKNPNLLVEFDLFASKHKTIDFYLGGDAAVQHINKNKPRFIHVTNNLEEILK
ncbi:MerR family transcriptional regulator [Virgibacillus flavescens]|uniref:MerR family transcriptional regulator n=1 Tax=Virgibacillus flavescens TaxID=1611422 RepID=UPI003D348345